MKHPRTRVAVIDVVALSRQMMEHMPRLSAWAEGRSVSSFPPAFPALTCSAQSTYVTGLSPREHAIPGNGWYNRNMCEIQFWKQSNKLVQGPRLWEKLRERYGSGFTCAKLFWWYNMYSTADWTITPRPMYPADGRKIFDIYTQPMELRETIKKDLGEFPFPTFWGPMAGIQSSQWIADSARWVERKHRPDLSLIYLPYLDYDLQKFGPSSTQAAHAAKAMDGLLCDLIDFLEREGVTPVVLSEYGISDVSRSIALNRLFRERGWITVKPEMGTEMLDCGASRAFAVADHQTAHIYINDPSVKEEEWKKSGKRTSPAFLPRLWNACRNSPPSQPRMHGSPTITGWMTPRRRTSPAAWTSTVNPAMTLRKCSLIRALPSPCSMPPPFC